MNVWYRTIEAGKRTLVFLHGVGSNHSIWNPYLSSFCQDRIILVDLPGHGRSQHIPFRTIQDAAQELIFILKKEGVHDACLVGQSLGGLVGLEAAVKAPDLVSKVAVSSPLSKGLIRAHSFFEATAWWLSIVSSKKTRERPFQDYSHACNNWFFMYPIMDFKGTASHTIGKAVLEASLYVPQWKEISQPVLIMHGSKDPFLKRRKLQENIMGKSRICMKEIPTHHLLITHARDHVVAALKGWLK